MSNSHAIGRGFTEQKCPVCGYKFEMHTMIIAGDRPQLGPKPGDVTVCYSCSVVLQFNLMRNPVIPSKADLDKIMADPRTKKLLQKVASTKIKN